MGLDVSVDGKETTVIGHITHCPHPHTRWRERERGRERERKREREVGREREREGWTQLFLLSCDKIHSNISMDNEYDTHESSLSLYD